MTRLAFHPAQHGWHFSNHFLNTILPGTLLRFQTHGLCGGLSMSALDYWRSGVPIPTHRPQDFRATGQPQEQLPAEGSRLRTYIYDRQMNSLLTAGMFSRWMVLPGFRPENFHDWAVGSEFEVIIRQISRGRPALLGLWSMGVGDVLGGHQVLCYGYDTAPVRLYVYDPNFHDTEMMLVPVSAERGCEMRVAATNEVKSVYRGYFWTDVYNWNEPPYQPHYHDLEIAAGLTLSPRGDNVPVATPMQAAVSVRNGGEYPAAFRNLFVWTRGPGGRNLDPLLGGAEPGLSVLHPGEQRNINRRCAAFGSEPGVYVVGLSYLSNQGNWHNINIGAPGTTGQQQVTLRRSTSLLVDKTVEVRESDRDVDTEINLEPGMEYALSASGSIWAGVWFTNPNGPTGWTDRIESNPLFPLHGSALAHPFSLIGRFEGLAYFYVGNGFGRTPYVQGGARRLWLRVNDDTPGNGSGSFRCRIQVWR